MQMQAVRLSAVAFVSTAMVWSGPVRGDEPAPFDWTGYYIGAHMGSGHANTSVANPFGLTLYGDEIPTQQALIGLQGGYNWQLPSTRWVFGAEGELTFLDTAGSNTCFAFNSAFYISSNCTNDPTYMGTLAARAGYAAGPSGKSLLYLKAGTAFIDNRLVAETNNAQILNATPARRTAYTTSWGVLIGAGLEQAIAPAWTLKFEYDYMRTGDFGFAAPPSNNVQLNDAMSPVPGRATHAHLDNSLFKVGLNYRFGENALAQWGSAGSIKPFASEGWSFEPVLRYWRSTGRFQKDLGAQFNTERRLVSRLTYDGLTANTNEIGARVDSPWLLFLKGYYGSGHIIGGHMNDEDWYYNPFEYDGTNVVLGYSNTLSILRDSGQRYYTVDAGLDILDGPDYRLGGFAGYNHIFESYGAMTCLSIASVMCYGDPHVYEAIISETDKWDSLRLGLAGDMWLTEGLKFAVDAAYLPYVRFSGFDNHWRRPLIINEHGNGSGMQLEAMLSYYFTEEFSLGLGARYWSLWTSSGTDAFNKSLTNRQVQYTYERYGVLAQATYKFD